MKLLLFGISTLICINSFANIDAGQKLYLKTCKECHGNGVKGAAMLTQEEWLKQFSNNGQLLIEKHDKTKAKSYFKGELFQKQQKSLLEFLKEYGSDSGNVPACG